MRLLKEPGHWPKRLFKEYIELPDCCLQYREKTLRPEVRGDLNKGTPPAFLFFQRFTTPRGESVEISVFTSQKCRKHMYVFLVRSHNLTHRLGSLAVHL